jgi:HipA-like C-terminal domain/HTH domain
MISRDIRAHLMQARDPVSATELAALLRVNRTTIVRSLPELRGDLLTMGATRSTRYLLRRNVRNIGNHWPIYRIDQDGQATQWAELEAVHDRGWRINWAAAEPGWANLFQQDHGMWIGFPFFLTEARPQGFLGRLITARLARMLALPDDLRYWSDDDVLIYLQMAGEDLPGNLVVGESTLRHALASAADLSPERVIREEDRHMSYPQAAVEIALNAPGSSAGGEQPKFLAHVQHCEGGFQSVLVKFSAPMEQETGRRWANLLACEFHAHEVLAQAGLATGGVRLLDAGGRRFLEVPRFDRHGASGRSGVVSLESLSTALDGLPRDWNDGAEMLSRRGLLDAETRSTIRALHAFGELMGNSDMHAGNLAFFLDDAMPLRLTPSYDMLPMLWAPGSQGEVINRPFAPAPPLPGYREEWQQAAEWANIFWQRVLDDSRVSEDFHRLAEQARAVVQRLQARV